MSSINSTKKHLQYQFLYKVYVVVVVVVRLITARRHVTGIMHDTILGPARGPSPQLSANAELQLGTNSTDATI